MISHTNYMTVNKNSYEIHDDSFTADEPTQEIKIESRICQFAGIFGVAYQIYLLLCC